jgi:hypothetical protein
MKPNINVFGQELTPKEDSAILNQAQTPAFSRLDN